VFSGISNAVRTLAMVRLTGVETFSRSALPTGSEDAIAGTDFVVLCVLTVSFSDYQVHEI